MSLDGLPQQFAEFVEHARARLHEEVTRTKKSLDVLNAERGQAQTALAELQEQRASAQKQLDAVMKDLQRLSELAGVGHNIVKARAELKRVETENAKAAKTLEACLKQISEADSRLVALGNEAQRQLGIRREAEAAYADIKARVYSVQLGQRP
jgi:chromosome segregation ATPase